MAHGWFVPADVPETPEQRVLEQSVRLPAGGAVTGWASCRLHGAAFFDGLGPDGTTRQPVPLVLGAGSGVRPGPTVSVTRDQLPRDEVTVRHGIRCTTPERAVFDAMRFATDDWEAVVAIDMAAAGRITSIRRMLTFLAAKAGWAGVGRARQALDLASERSRSPAETRMRLVWVLIAGLPTPLVNWPVLDRDGRRLAVVDLLDADAGVVGEYDGADHRRGRRHTRDVGREDRLRRARLEYFTVTGGDMHDLEHVAARMLATRERALWLPPETRLWRPGAVDPGDSVDFELDRRDLVRGLQDDAASWTPPDVAGW